jgi:type IV pilus assembly protein PilC
MPKYAYKARDALGKQVEGMLEAADEKAAAENLARSGYFATSIKMRREAAPLSLLSRLRGVRRRQLIMVSRQLATMIKAGLPLLSGLDVIIQQTKDPVLSIVLREIRLDLNEGSSFTEALSRHPSVFSKLYVSTVKVGEETGNLDEVLFRQADFIEWEDSLRAAILGSLLYPIIIMCVAFGVLIFLLIVVLPQFQKVYTRANVPLPPITRVMFTLSWFVTNYWYVILAALVALVAGYILFKRTSHGRLAVDRFKLRIPIVKEFIGKIAAVRFARSLEIMARSGVAVVGALHIIRETMTNAVFSRAMDDMSTQVEAGRTIASALGDYPEFDLMLVQMVAVGEETGQLDEMLGFVGDAYEQQIDYMSKNLPKIIEPILLIFLAGMVAVIALSLFLPIFKMVEVVHRIQ